MKHLYDVGGNAVGTPTPEQLEVGATADGGWIWLAPAGNPFASPYARNFRGELVPREELHGHRASLARVRVA
mgnify:CR=1 FL=1